MMKRALLLAAAATLVASMSPAPTPRSRAAKTAGAAVRALPAPPTTPRKSVTLDYQGVHVTDDYQWLESGAEPQVRHWSEEQNGRTRQFLDHLPAVAAIRKRVTQLESAASADYTDLRYRAGTLFSLKFQPPKQQPFLVSLKSADDLRSERVIVDPNRMNPKGTTAIDFYVPSLDGRLVAVSLSEGGSESGDVSVFDAATGRKLPDLIPRVNGGTAGGSLTWNRDGSGFYYTRYPRGRERPPEDFNFYQQVYFHKLGAPASEDVYCIGKEFPRIAEIALQTSDDGRYVLASVANGDGGEYSHYLLSPAGTWSRITDFSDKIVSVKIGPDGVLYLLSRNGAARGKILRLSPETPLLARAETAVQEGDGAILDFEPAASRIYVVISLGGPEQLLAFDREGRKQKPVEIKPISSVGQVVRLASDDILFRNESYLDPPAWFRFDAAAEHTLATALFRTSPAKFADTEVVRESAPSKDGTKIPMSVIRLKGTPLNHGNATILTGYGGFGVNRSPSFDAVNRLWIEQGGVIASANLRGGGEYGEDWHRAGNLTNKQNVFDDFSACAQRLIEAGYTSPGKLAIRGGSNGGLLMGAALTQHPELFRAVVSHAGIYDMLRVETTPNGAFNVTEYGTVKDPAQFKALYAYSPYHHVADGTAYPAVLFLTGANDPRVDPWHSRKMTARLQAATSSGLPILLRTSGSTGHGIGSALSEVISEEADVFTFLFDQLGVSYMPVGERPTAQKTQTHRRK